MIYTVTLNPAVDYVVELTNFQTGIINRTEKELKYPGGKGINVSRVLHVLGETSAALGFAGGFTGKYVIDTLAEENISTDFIEVNGDTRINVKIRGGEETEINGASPEITTANIKQLEKQLAGLNNGDQLVLAGSVPKNLVPHIYKQFMDVICDKEINVYLDSSGLPLKKALAASPYFIKPNHLELAELYETSLSSLNEIIVAGKRLIADYGVNHAVISMAGEGALYISSAKVLLAKPPAGKLVNSVGAGDSLVAGFLAKHQHTENPEKILAYAVAAGSATAYSEGFCTKEEVERLEQAVTIKELQAT
ncbi:1-phosphofructokinase [Alteribacillus sp. HJP-4]|uniref:1-phosphofructokinase n=1 Tax=Alteribacillus sp. HJP-4 TaxID=2775394 RepID=UPI0035CCE775